MLSYRFPSNLQENSKYPNPRKANVYFAIENNVPNFIWKYDKSAPLLVYI